MHKRLRIALAIACALLVFPSLMPTSLPAGEIAVRMRKARPNPFTEGTTFQLTMPRPSHVYIAVFDLLGRHIRTLRDEAMPAGTYDVHWDGNDDHATPVQPGPYLCTLFMDNHAVSCAKVVKARGR